MMIILLLVISCMTWILFIQYKKKPYEELYKHIKYSVPRWPIIGHLHTLLCSKEVVADSEVADILMKTCLEKDDVINCFHVATGDGSIFASVEKWRPRRKYLAPTVGMKNLICYVNTFSKLSSEVVKKIEEEKSDGRDTIPLYKVYFTYAMNSIFGSLGLSLKVEEKQQFQLALEVVMTEIINRIFHPWLYNDFLYKLTGSYKKFNHFKPLLYGVFEKAIRKKRKEIKKFHETTNEEPSSDNSSIGLKTFISLMIESPANVSDAVIREECVVMVSAASDTIAVSLGYVTLMLARHPEQQAIIYDELKEVIGDTNRPILPEDLPRLKHLDAFIKETLRLYPPVPVVVRKVDRNITLPSGLTLVAGCGIFINIWAINRNPLYWGADAERFRPSRCQDPGPRHPAAFVAFSHGPRNCLGYQYAMMSLKTVTARILGRFRVEAPTEDFMHQPLRVKYDFMMRHLDNYTVKFVSR